MTCSHDYHYYPDAANESGWRCVACDHKPGEPPGFSPELDRSETVRKVMAILLDLDSSQIINVSNGEQGEAIELSIAARCRKEGRFDQYSIALYILELMTPSHARYWSEISDGIVAGNDPRDRCACGKLAKVYSGAGRWCSEHAQDPFGEVPAGAGGGGR